MKQDVIYEFSAYADARSAVKRIHARYSLDDVTGLSFVSDDCLHVVAACTDRGSVADGLRHILQEHNGRPSPLDMDGVILMPATMKILGNAGPAMDLMK